MGLDLDATERDLSVYALDEGVDNEDPHWLSEALSIPIVDRIRTMGAALWFFAHAPYRFGEAWFRGTAVIPNPLVAMAASMSVLAILGQEIRRALVKEPGAHTILSSVAETLGPYVMYVGTGLVAHLVLRALGSRRRLRTTIGMTLLAGAGPGTVLALGITVPPVLLVRHYGSVDAMQAGIPMAARTAVVVAVLVLYFGFLAVFQLGLAGAHGITRWKGVVAGTVAVIAMAFVCGALEHTSLWPHLVGSMGPHLSLYKGASGMSFGFNY
jgi:hypothetical protein